MLTAGVVTRAMEIWAPREWAQAGDAIGLQVGDLRLPIHGILVTLDVTPQVVEEAASRSLDLIIAHHPLFFQPVSSLDFTTYPGRTAQALIKAGVSLYVAHTNLDAAPDGPSQLLAQSLGLRDIIPLVPLPDRSAAQVGSPVGMGRIGDLTAPWSLEEFSRQARALMPGATLRVSGTCGTITRVGLCTGSGRSLVGEALKAGAQVFLTGECSYHAALEGDLAGLAIVEAGHYDTEVILVPRLVELLGKKFPQLEVAASSVCTDPSRRSAVPTGAAAREGGPALG